MSFYKSQNQNDISYHKSENNNTPLHKIINESDQDSIHIEKK